MKRFFQVFFFLLFFSLLSTTIYLNFIIVKNGELAILIEKTEGIIDQPLRAGRHWIWGVSIPGKYSIHRLNTNIQSKNIVFRRKILEAAHLDLGEKFDIIIPLRISYSIDANKCIELFEALERKFSKIKSLVKSKISPLLYIKYTELSSIPGNTFLVSDRLQIFIQDELKQKLNLSLKGLGIKIHSLVINRAKGLQVPTLSIQDRLRFSKYEDYFQRRKEELLKTIQEKSKLDLQKQKDKVYYNKLKQVGQLIQDYPELLDYIAIEKLNPNVSVIYGSSIKNVIPKLPNKMMKAKPEETKTKLK